MMSVGEPDARPTRKCSLHVRDRFQRAGAGGHALFVVGDHARFHLGDDRVDRLVERQLLLHHPRPADRAPPHRQPLKLVGPDQAAVSGELDSRFVPVDFAIDEDAVHVVDDRFDGHESPFLPFHLVRYCRGVSYHGFTPDRLASTNVGRPQWGRPYINCRILLLGEVAQPLPDASGRGPGGGVGLSTAILHDQRADRPRRW